MKYSIKKIIPAPIKRFIRKKQLLLDKKLDRVFISLGLSNKLQKNISPTFKIGMAVLCHERPEYLELCLDSLFETKLYEYDITFLLIDDGSKNTKIPELINKPRQTQYKIIRQFTEKGNNSWGAAFNKAIHRLNEIGEFDIIGTCDSDAFFHPEWLDKTMKIAIWAKKNHQYHTLGPFSSFNSSDENFHQPFGTYQTPHGDFVVKKRMGALNYFYFKQDLDKLGLFEENKDDETLMTARFEKMRVRNFCTNVSYIEHIGELSVLNQWRPTAVKKAVYGLNLARNGWSAALSQIFTFGFLRFVQPSQTVKVKIASTLNLEAFIVVTDKDAESLPLVIESVRKNLQHPITAIHIISGNSEKIKKICKQTDCLFVSEDSFLPINRKHIKYVHGEKDRSGWLFQQLLKLGADAICREKHFFVIDADTILIQAQKFEIDNKLLLLHADEYHSPYFEVNRKLTGLSEVTAFSCVAHQMLFSTERLQALKAHLEKIHKKPWYQCITDFCDYSQISGFSEFELYGQWSLQKYPTFTSREYWFNIALPRSKITDLADLEKKYNHTYRSVSFHSYLKG